MSFNRVLDFDAGLDFGTGSDGRRASVSWTVLICFASASERVNERSHSVIWGLARDCLLEGGMQLTRQRAIKGLLPRMASHMRLQCIRAGMWLALPRAIHPLTRILLPSCLDMIIMYMRYQFIHISTIAGVAALPHAYGDLLVVAVFVFESGYAGGIGHVARCI